jgi:hypothetical protein
MSWNTALSKRGGPPTLPVLRKRFSQPFSLWDAWKQNERPTSTEH